MGGRNQEGLELKDLLDCGLFKDKGKWKESKLCIDKLLFLYFVPATSVVTRPSALGMSDPI